MAKRILFVDDESRILEGLQRSLRVLREWELEFACGAAAALAAIEQRPFDIIVTDMRMPGMDGAELLERVTMLSPSTIRIVFSGQSSRSSAVRLSVHAHQYLSKPCKLEELRSVLARALKARDLLDHVTLKELVSQLRALPSLPSLYRELATEMQGAEPSLAKIGEIIVQDVGMSAKILQLANSAFFGLPRRVSSLGEAVSHLGPDNLKALVSASAFCELDSRLVESVTWLWEHSVMTAALAKAITRCQGASPKIIEDVFTAGLLHDVGKLLFAVSLPDLYLGMLQTGDNLALEQRTFGCTHEEVGAYLAVLWGLPDGVVEAMTLHHRPPEPDSTEWSPLIAIHVADQMCRQMPGPKRDESGVRQLWQHLSLQYRLPNWAQVCAAMEEV